MNSRRFPAPWSAEVQPNYYVVRDANRQQLAYVYYENEPGRRSAAKLLSKDEARRDCCELGKVARATEVALGVRAARKYPKYLDTMIAIWRAIL